MTFTKEQLTKIIDSADEVITALAGTNEDIHPEDSKKMCDAWDHLNDVAAPPEVVKRLAEIALAALTAEPVADNDFMLKNLDRALGVLGMALPESREEFNLQQERWIQRLIDRVIRCADELSPPPAPVVPDRFMFEAWWESQNGAPLDNWGSLRTTDGYCDDIIDGQFEAWNACCAAMLRTRGEAAQLLDLEAKDSVSGPGQSEPVSQRDELPEGYCIMPMKLTAENGAKGALSGEFSETKFINCPECFGDDECETCDGSGRLEITVPVSWTTIKAIWAKGVEHFSAAPQKEVK